MTGEIKGQGFILRQVQAQDADVILRILTRTGEQITAFAKAGLKSRKRFGGALQPLTNIDFRAMKKGSQDMYYLEEAQARHDFPGIRTDIERLAAASYVAEVTEHSSHEGLENVELYNLFGATLRALESGAWWLGTLRQFEVKLLSLLGWLPSLTRCSSCGASGKPLTLNPEAGEATCEDCGISAIPISQETQEVVKRLSAHSILNTKVTDEEANKIERLTSSLLQAHWGQQKLKSTQFLGSLRRFQK